MIDESAGKRRKQYVDRPSGESKICLIHGPGNSSDEWKVLGDIGANKPKGETTKYRGNHTIIRKMFNSQQENNSIVNNVVDDILIN